MKRLVFFFTLLIVICVLNGCRNERGEIPAPQRAFIRSFSLASIIQANEQYLIARQTVSSGMEESERPATFFQKDENAIVRIDSTNVSAFMAAVRADIEKAIVGSGAKVHGRGTGREGPEGGLADITSFSFRYLENGANGVINVWGVRGEGTSFSLIVLLTEN